MDNTLLWEPKLEQISKSQMFDFMQYVNRKFNLSFSNYQELHNWSIEENLKFWELSLSYFDIIYSEPHTEIAKIRNGKIGAEWFPGLKLNFAENLLKYRDDKVALSFHREDGENKTITYRELYEQVSSFALFFRHLGIEKGDRVVGYLPNCPEAVIAMLAAASIGAVWSSCSSDFGENAVLDRFSQIEPKLLISANGYSFKGKKIPRYEPTKQIMSNIKSIENCIYINYIDIDTDIFDDSFIYWDSIDIDYNKINFEQVDFSHPLYIMYSSGTTGKPKSIVHSAGGTLIQHLKELQLHVDLKRSDNIFYFTTCGWMMWNWLVSSLAVGATIMLYDGNPFYPNPKSLLEIADKNKISIFGTSAKYISSLEDSDIKPNQDMEFKYLRMILSTGSPLYGKNYDYVYNNWKKDLALCSISGGTDIISCFVLGNPMLNIYRGKLQCIGLGMDVKSYNSNGVSVIGEKGELVCENIFPSMPIYFWNDQNNQKYKKAYFTQYENVWTHGDFISINLDKGIEIFGRSDATLNPSGVRIGTSEIYNVVEKIDEVSDCVVAGYKIDNDEKIILFINLIADYKLDDKLIFYIKDVIKKDCSPRHVPHNIYEVDSIPYTSNGKKIEIAVKQIINGEDVSNLESIANPKSLNCYKNLNISN